MRDRLVQLIESCAMGLAPVFYLRPPAINIAALREKCETYTYLGGKPHEPANEGFG